MTRWLNNIPLNTTRWETRANSLRRRTSSHRSPSATTFAHVCPQHRLERYCCWLHRHLVCRWCGSSTRLFASSCSCSHSWRLWRAELFGVGSLQRQYMEMRCECGHTTGTLGASHSGCILSVLWAEICEAGRQKKRWGTRKRGRVMRVDVER